MIHSNQLFMSHGKTTNVLMDNMITINLNKLLQKLRSNKWFTKLSFKKAESFSISPEETFN